MRILVVEDEKRIADFLGRGLQGAGYAVDVALDGANALHLNKLQGVLETLLAVHAAVR